MREKQFQQNETCFQGICKLHWKLLCSFNFNGLSKLTIMAPAIGMDSVTHTPSLHAGLLDAGICSLVKPTAMTLWKNWRHFAPKSTNQCITVTSYMSVNIPLFKRLFRITNTINLTGHLGDESTGNWWITHRKRQWWRVFLCMELIGSLEWESFPVDAHLVGCFGNQMGPGVLIGIIT